MNVILKRFESPDETRTFPRGKFEVVRIGDMTIGLATYEPGWKWSEDVGKALGRASCDVEHVGLVLAGRADVTMDDGRVWEIGAGDLFSIPAGHDSSVLGNQPYVSLHLMGASAYARSKDSQVSPGQA